MDALVQPSQSHSASCKQTSGPLALKNIVEDRFDIVLTTGIVPRIPDIDHPKVISYLDAILETKPVGKRVAIIGAGGIGCDLAEYITEPRTLYSELVLRRIVIPKLLSQPILINIDTNHPVFHTELQRHGRKKLLKWKPQGFKISIPKK